MDYFLINWVFESLKKSNIFWLASALVEPETDQETGSLMLCHLSRDMPHHYL